MVGRVSSAVFSPFQLFTLKMTHVPYLNWTFEMYFHFFLFMSLAKFITLKNYTTQCCILLFFFSKWNSNTNPMEIREKRRGIIICVLIVMWFFQWERDNSEHTQTCVKNRYTASKDWHEGGHTKVTTRIQIQN